MSGKVREFDHDWRVATLWIKWTIFSIVELQYQVLLPIIMMQTGFSHNVLEKNNFTV